MYSREQLIEFHDEIRTAKEHMWYKHKEPDLYPILSIRWRDMEPQSINVPLMGTLVEGVRDFAVKQGVHNWITDTPMNAALVLWACVGAADDGILLPGIEQMPPKGTPMEGIWLACEGYGYETEDLEEAAGVKHGNLKEDYENNPDSKVYERLTTYQVETGPLGTAEWGRVTSAFHKDDGGRIVWHEHIIHSSDDTAMDNDWLHDDGGGFDRLLAIMCPHVTREKLA